MNKKAILSVNFTKEKDIYKVSPDHSFVNVYDTKILGQGLIHLRHPDCEFNEAYIQQHGIVVHLRPEQNSLRRMGDRVEVENVNVGDMAIIPANVNHWQRIEAKVSEGIVLTLEPQVISRLARETIDPDKLELLPTFAQPDPLIQGLALNIKACLDSDYCDLLFVESMYQVLAMHLVKNYATRRFNLEDIGNGLPPYQLKKVLNYIHDHLDKRIKIEDLANLLDLSTYYLCRQFRASVGVSPYRYVINKRIEQAKSLLKDEKLSLADIAYECGFSSQSQMTQHFRTSLGVTPKVYRNSL